MTKKQYSFRLKDSDDSLGAFLQNLSGKFKNESEAIRQMLLYAHKHLLAEQEEQKQIIQMQRDLKRIKEQQDKHHSELLKTLHNFSLYKNEGLENKKQKDDRIAQDTANALLSGFGINLE